MKIADCSRFDSPEKSATKLPAEKGNIKVSDIAAEINNRISIPWKGSKTVAANLMSIYRAATRE